MIGIEALDLSGRLQYAKRFNNRQSKEIINNNIFLINNLPYISKFNSSLIYTYWHLFM